MDPVLTQKIQTVLEDKNGKRTLDIMYMSAYIAPGDIPNIIFGWIFPDLSELKGAIQFLNRLSLIEATDEFSFRITPETRAKLRQHLSSKEVENVLKRTVSFLIGARLVDYIDLQMADFHVKVYPSLLEEFCQLPGRVLFGMLKTQAFQAAYEFGATCNAFLIKNQKEFDREAMELKYYLDLALLSLMMEREKAITMLTDVYKKSSRVIGKESDGALLKLVVSVLDRQSRTVSKRESRSRLIIFRGETVSDPLADLDKWVLYCESLIRFHLFDEALPILEEVIEERRQHIWMYHPDNDGVLNAIQVQARGLMEKGQLDETMELLENAFECRKNELGLMHLKTLSIQIDMGKVMKNKKQYDDSLTLFEEVAKHVKQIAGKAHELYLVAIENMVDIYRQKRDLEKAFELSSNLATSLVSNYGVCHPKSNQCRFILGEILSDMGKHQEARVGFEELLEVAKKTSASAYEIRELQRRIFIATPKIAPVRVTRARGLPVNAEENPLLMAALKGDLETVVQMIEAGEDIEVQTPMGYTPMRFASVFNHVEIVKVLIENGARFDGQANDVSTPYHSAKGEIKKLLRTIHLFFTAVRENDVDQMTTIALKEPLVLKARDNFGCTPVHWAASRGHGNALRALLELGCDPTVESYRVRTPLHSAADKGHISIAKSILQAVGPAKATYLVNRRNDYSSFTPLHEAASKGSVDMVRVLLTHGAFYRLKTKLGKTPLQMSKDEDCKNLLGIIDGLFQDTSKGDVEAVREKLRGLKAEDVPAVTRAKDEENRTLLQVARELRHPELAKELLMFTIKDI